MAKNNNLSDLLKSIADAIRSKKGTTAKINAQNFASEIESIQTGGGTTVTDNYVIWNKLPTIKMYWDSIPNDGILPAKAFQIGANFGYNNSLKEIYLPSINIINSFAFQNHVNLDIIYIPNCTIIQGGLSFANCSAIASIELPKITSISNATFSDCTSLKKVIIGTNESTTICTLGGAGAFTNTPIATSETEGFIYVADSLVDQYKEATNWVTYATKIKGISDLPVEG